MRLRSLEIQGFKSFPDKTYLTFRDGITAVVGPNGSGKSNIADAMRWVLGEQSTKTLRGDRMEDVIFGGTQTRKAQGYAQVQVTIENSGRELLYDNDEVTISRKLYRSGESEYRINNVNVRLKDVYMLFMDTGMGKDGYSMIGQGKIAEIVSAKSGQRREIFEEAAGITKHRYRKQEAQKSLACAEENLARLMDILMELEIRVEPLRIQSEKAAKFLKLSDEKKTLEISIWMRTIDEYKLALRAQEDKILLSKGEHDNVQEKLDEIETNINNLFERMQKLAVEIEERRAEMRNIEQKAAQNDSEIAVLKNDREHNASSVERLCDELERSGASGEDTGERIHTREVEIERGKNELSDLRIAADHTREAQKALIAEQSSCIGKIDSLKESRYGLTQSMNEAKLSSASSTSLIDETIERLQSLKESTVIRDENAQRIRQEAADCAELLVNIEENMQSLINSRKGYEIRLESRQLKYNGLLEQHRTFEDKVRGCLQKAKLLTDMENSMEGFQNSVKYIMGQSARGAIRDVYGPVSRLITVEDQYALAIEIALGAAMQNIVVKDENAAKRAIGMLREAKAGRATFLPVSTIRGNRLSDSWLLEALGFIGIGADLVSCADQFKGILAQLLGRTVIAENLDCATEIAKRGSYRFRVVTLDGQVINAGGSMTGGWAVKSAGILSRSKEIESLKEEACCYQREMEKLDLEMKTAREALSAEEAVISGIVGEIATAQEDKIRYTAEQKQLKSALEEAIKLREHSVIEYDRLTERLKQLKEKNITNAGLAKELSEQIDAVAVDLLELSKQRETFTERREAFLSTLTHVGIREAALTQEIEGLRQMISQLTLQQQNQKEHINDIKRQIEEHKNQDTQLLIKIESAEKAHTEFTVRTESLRDEIQKKTDERNSCERETTSLRAGEKTILERRESAGRELARLEEKRNTIQGDYDSIIARLWDEYELTRTQAMEISSPIEDSSKAHRRLTEVKAEIKVLGNVNVAALEEYKEVSKRYNELKAQTDDVEKARTELLNLISSLTTDMQKIFYENFKLIAENFSAIFDELFVGGHGELTLSDPKNLLESGIEIHVQPPGKLVGNMTLLSGGEQSLVAIAIYFAILKVRPAPFVLLDEIEAALDDVNVMRYAQYLRTMCKSTQFIAITHRRGTMEEADVLYGVTMQEEGVSKLLELDVCEVEGKLGMK